MDEVRQRCSADYATAMQGRVEWVEGLRRQAWDIRQKIPIPNAAPSEAGWEAVFVAIEPLATELAKCLKLDVKDARAKPVQREKVYDALATWADQVKQAATTKDRSKLINLGITWDTQIALPLTAHLKRREVLVPPKERKRSTPTQSAVWTPALYHAQQKLYGQSPTAAPPIAPNPTQFSLFPGLLQQFQLAEAQLGTVPLALLAFREDEFRLPLPGNNEPCEFHPFGTVFIESASDEHWHIAAAAQCGYFDNRNLIKRAAAEFLHLATQAGASLPESARRMIPERAHDSSDKWLSLLYVLNPPNAEKLDGKYSDGSPRRVFWERPFQSSADTVAEVLKLDGAVRELPPTVVPDCSEQGQWLTIGDAERISGINRGVISRAADDGLLRSNGKRGRGRRIHGADFNRWQLERANKLTPQESDSVVRRKLSEAEEA